jgi:hypothetical protein
MDSTEKNRGHAPLRGAEIFAAERNSKPSTEVFELVALRSLPVDPSARYRAGAMQVLSGRVLFAGVSRRCVRQSAERLSREPILKDYLI